MIDFAVVDEQVVLTADGPEARMVMDLARQLDGMLERDDDDAVARLLPDMIRDDAVAAAELRALVEPSLIAHKRENARLVLASLQDPGVLDPADEEAWARVLTDLRLTIATRLGIEHDDDAGSRRTKLDRSLQQVYAWLGGLQEHLIGVLDHRDAARERR